MSLYIINVFNEFLLKKSINFFQSISTWVSSRQIIFSMEEQEEQILKCTLAGTLLLMYRLTVWVNAHPLRTLPFVSCKHLPSALTANFRDPQTALLSCPQPTSPNRGWFVPPFGGNPWWVYLAAALPALLVTILLFMDQQITAVIVNRKEHKLKVGLPWVCCVTLSQARWFITLTLSHPGPQETFTVPGATILRYL